jgi:hypothetical protein
MKRMMLFLIPLMGIVALLTTVYGQEVGSAIDSAVTREGLYVGSDTAFTITDWTPSLEFYTSTNEHVMTFTWNDTLKVVVYIPMNEAARVFVDWIAEYYSLRIKELKDEVAFYKKQLEDKK